MARTSGASSRTASLKSLFSRARFVHADDVVARRCRTRANECRPGDLYVASSSEDDVDEAAAQAVARGVAGIITERLLPFTTPQCLVQDAEWAYARVCDALADSPGKKLLTIGVVGHHGKTSAVVAIAAVLRQQGLRTAYLCDLGSSDGVTQGLPAARHSNAQQVTQWLSDACDAQSSVAILEMSAEMLRHQHAMPAYPDILVVTDGKDLALVRRAAEFLEPEGVIVAAADCPRLERWLETCEHGVMRYGINADVEVNGVIFRREQGEMTLLVTAGDTTAAVQSKLTGRLLAQAQLAAVATGLLLGADLATCAAGLQRLVRIPGRTHRLPALSGPAVFLDVASDAPRLKASLKAIRGEVPGVLHAVIMIPEKTNSTERAALGMVAEKQGQKLVLCASPSGRETYLRDVHDVLDGVERPERVSMIANWRQAVRATLKRCGERDAMVIVCPQGDLSAEAHRELLEAIAKVAQESSAPKILSHPSLLAAS